ncbi:MAG: hypothetical protein ABI672_18365 [Vicinamibacteria bacterium]
MEITRKGFISSVAAAMAAASLPMSSIFSGANVGPSVSADVALDEFSKHVGSSFRLALPSGTQTMVLDRVDQANSCRRTEQFSLVFRIPSVASVPPGSYRVRHEAMGPLDMFLVPGLENSVRADFNLLKA